MRFNPCLVKSPYAMHYSPCAQDICGARGIYGVASKTVTDDLLSSSNSMRATACPGPGNAGGARQVVTEAGGK